MRHNESLHTHKPNNIQGKKTNNLYIEPIKIPTTTTTINTTLMTPHIHKQQPPLSTTHIATLTRHWEFAICRGSSLWRRIHQYGLFGECVWVSVCVFYDEYDDDDDDKRQQKWQHNGSSRQPAAFNCFRLSCCHFCCSSFGCSNCSWLGMNFAGIFHYY